MSTIIDKIEQEQMRQDHPDFRPGDSVKVHIRIIEGSKERVQIFQGVVIKRKRGTMNASYTVRKISNGVGVEKTFALHNPRIEKIEVISVVEEGDVKEGDSVAVNLEDELPSTTSPTTYLIFFVYHTLWNDNFPLGTGRWSYNCSLIQGNNVIWSGSDRKSVNLGGIKYWKVFRVDHDGSGEIAISTSIALDAKYKFVRVLKDLQNILEKNGLGGLPYRVEQKHNNSLNRRADEHDGVTNSHRPPPG